MFPNWNIDEETLGLELMAKIKNLAIAIRINSQWRICFKWQEGNALNVEIVDYH